MTTLAEVNATLGITNIALSSVVQEQKETNKGISAFVDFIKDKDAEDSRKEIEASREAKASVLKTGLATAGSGVASAGRATLGFGKGLFNRLGSLIPAGLATGFITSFLGSKLLRFGLPAAGLLLGDEIAEALTGKDASPEFKKAIAGAIKGSSIGFLFGRKGLLLGGIIGTLLTNKEVDEQLGDLTTNVKNLGAKLFGKDFSLASVLEGVTKSVGENLKGLNNLLKGNFDSDNLISTLKILAGAAFLISPVGSAKLAFRAIAALRRTPAGKALLLLTAGGFLADKIFNQDSSDPSLQANEYSGGGNKNMQTKEPGFTDMFELSDLLYLPFLLGLPGLGSLKKIPGLFKRGAKPSPGFYTDLRKPSATNMYGPNSKTGTGFRTELNLKNLDKAPKPTSILNKMFNIVKAGGRFGLTMLKGFPLLLPATVMAEVTSALLPTKEMTEEQNIKANIQKMTGNRDAKSTDLGIVDDFGLSGGSDNLMANRGRRMKKEDPLIAFFASQAGLRNASTDYKDPIMSIANSGNTNTTNVGNQIMTSDGVSDKKMFDASLAAGVL